MITIWYGRHAQTHDNATGVASGHRDVALTDAGREQARTLLRAKYAGEPFDIVFTSDTQRAYDTARLIFEGRDIPIVQNARLRECDYGDLTGKPHAELAASQPPSVATPFPNGESYQQVAERIRSFLEDLAAQNDGEKVMIIGHRATSWMLHHLLGGIPLDEAIQTPFIEPPEIFTFEPG